MFAHFQFHHCSVGACTVADADGKEIASATLCPQKLSSAVEFNQCQMFFYSVTFHSVFDSSVIRMIQVAYYSYRAHQVPNTEITGPYSESYYPVLYLLNSHVQIYLVMYLSTVLYITYILSCAHTDAMGQIELAHSSDHILHKSLVSYSSVSAIVAYHSSHNIALLSQQCRAGRNGASLEALGMNERIARFVGARSHWYSMCSTLVTESD